MGRECTYGTMEGSMKESTIWIRSMVMGYIRGLMEGSMRDCGRMGSKMVKGSIYCLME